MHSSSHLVVEAQGFRRGLPSAGTVFPAAHREHGNAAGVVSQGPLP